MFVINSFLEYLIINKYLFIVKKILMNLPTFYVLSMLVTKHKIYFCFISSPEQKIQ